MVPLRRAAEAERGGRRREAGCSPTKPPIVNGAVLPVDGGQAPVDPGVVAFDPRLHHRESVLAVEPAPQHLTKPQPKEVRS